MSTSAWREANQDKLREYRRDWYARNKTKAKTRIVERRRGLTEWLTELKGQLKCKYCPESDVACLDFHHRDHTQKDSSIGEALRYGWGKERILEEIAKCDVLCSNCHRKLHWRDRHRSVV